MEGCYIPMKMKRKNLDKFNDDFSDFSLSSPATKIRRLDVDLPPIIEEEEMEMPMIERSIQEQSCGNNAGAVAWGGRGVVIEELPNEPVNEERGLVIFKPMNSPLVSSPSNFSVTVNPQLISDFKSQVWSNQSNPFRRVVDEATEDDKNSGERNDHLAVVPWVPSQLPSAASTEVRLQTDLSDMMDAEEMENVKMDVEDNSVGFQQAPFSGTGSTIFSEGVNQWQQQHCMIPQPPQNTSTPILWYR